MKPSFKAFTLIELMIVLVIMGIIVMMTMRLSGYHIQTLQQKVVKEKILSTYQSYYSRNLTSSYAAGERYETMHLDLLQWSGTFSFSFTPAEGGTTPEPRIFSDKFVIDHMLTNPRDSNTTKLYPKKQLNITYHPYEIFCTITSEDDEDRTENMVDEVVLILTIREMKKYCFNISAKSCRMREVECLDQRFPEFNETLRRSQTL